MLYKNRLNEYLKSLSPLILWEMSDASGSGPTDISGNGIHGVFNNVITSNSPGIMIDGVAQGCRFLGNSFISSEPRTYNFSDGCSLCFFLRPASASGNHGFANIPFVGAGVFNNGNGDVIYTAGNAQGQMPCGSANEGLGVVFNGNLFPGGVQDYFFLSSTSQALNPPFISMNGAALNATTRSSPSYFEQRKAEKSGLGFTLGRSIANFWPYYFTGWMANLCLFDRLLSLEERTIINSLATTGAWPVENSIIEGSVHVDGDAASKRVFAYKRNDGNLIGNALSGGDGVFSIPYSASLAGQSAVLVSLDDAATEYEALGFDRVVLG